MTNNNQSVKKQKVKTVLRFGILQLEFICNLVIMI